MKGGHISEFGKRGKVRRKKKKKRKKSRVRGESWWIGEYKGKNTLLVPIFWRCFQFGPYI